MESQNFVATNQEKLHGKNHQLDVVWLKNAIKKSKSICKIVTQFGNATGFIVTLGNSYERKIWLLTNNHVISSATSAIGAELHFNYQKSKLPQSVRITQVEEFYTNPDLDYSILTTPDFRNLENTYVKAFELTKNFEWYIEIGEHASILGHPQGKPLKCSFRKNKILHIENNFFTYQTDTEPGSSGSPIFNDKWQLIGIHKYGTEISNGGIRIGKIIVDLISISVSRTQSSIINPLSLANGLVNLVEHRNEKND